MEVDTAPSAYCAIHCHTGNIAVAAQGGVAFSKTLQVPTPFAAADVISRDDQQEIEYHYTIVEVCDIAFADMLTLAAS